MGCSNAPRAATFARSSHLVWFVPPPVTTDQWRDPDTGAFTAANDPINDMRIRYRVFDVDGGGWLASNDNGEVRLGFIDIDHLNLDNMVV